MKKIIWNIEKILGKYWKIILNICMKCSLRFHLCIKCLSWAVYLFIIWWKWWIWLSIKKCTFMHKIGKQYQGICGPFVPNLKCFLGKIYWNTFFLAISGFSITYTTAKEPGLMIEWPVNSAQAASWQKNHQTEVTTWIMDGYFFFSLVSVSSLEREKHPNQAFSRMLYSETRTW